MIIYVCTPPKKQHAYRKHIFCCCMLVTLQSCCLLVDTLWLWFIRYAHNLLLSHSRTAQQVIHPTTSSLPDPVRHGLCRHSCLLNVWFWCKKMIYIGDHDARVIASKNQKHGDTDSWSCTLETNNMLFSTCESIYSSMLFTKTSLHQEK